MPAERMPPTRATRESRASRTSRSACSARKNRRNGTSMNTTCHQFRFQNSVLNRAM